VTWRIGLAIFYALGVVCALHITRKGTGKRWALRIVSFVWPLLFLTIMLLVAVEALMPEWGGKDEDE
jgi:hypothetical protein